MRYVRFVIAGLALSAGTASAGPVGDAIGNQGGSQASVNAGNAIHVTCQGFIDLTANGGTLNDTQTDLFGRCGDMVNTSLAYAGTGNGNFYSLDLGNPDELFGVLRQFSGEENSSQGRYATEGSVGQFASLSGRLSAIRRGARTSGLAVNLQGIDVLAKTGDDSSQLAPNLVGGNAGSADADTGWAWFGNVDYGFGDRDSSQNENGYDSDSYGFTIGADYVPSDSGMAFGVALAYQDADVDFDNVGVSGLVTAVAGGGIEADSLTFSVFGNYAPGPYYVSGILSFTDTDYDFERLIVVPESSNGGTVRAPAQRREIVSSTDSTQFSGQLQAGYSFGTGATTMDVFGAIEFLSSEVDDYAERSGSGGDESLALEFDEQDIDSQQAVLGASVRRAIATDSGVMIPYATLEYRHEFDNDARFVNARYRFSRTDFVGPTGDTDNFRIPTDDPDENFFNVTVGLSAQMGNNLFLFAQYSALVGLEDTNGNLITVGIRGNL